MKKPSPGAADSAAIDATLLTTAEAPVAAEATVLVTEDLPAAELPAEELPAAGGSYTRLPDGSLRRDEEA